LLFSVIFRSAATAALAGLAVWLLFAFFWQMLVPIVTVAIAPPDPFDPLSTMHTINLGLDISRISPNTLFAEATTAFLSPTTRALGPIFASQMQGAIKGAPLPLGESLAIVWPQLTALLAAVILLFVIAYVLFQRQEVRA
jgi:ABC-2 type transport system permease protein